MSKFALLDVEGPDYVSEESEPEPLSPVENIVASPLSKKARARARRRLQKTSSSNLQDTIVLEPQKINGDVTAKKESLPPIETRLPTQGQSIVIPQGSQSAPSITASSVSDFYAEDEDSSEDEEPVQEDTAKIHQVQPTKLPTPLSLSERRQPSVAELTPKLMQQPQFKVQSPPSSPRRATRPEAPQSKDHMPNSKMKSIITRTVWTFLMFAGFVALILLGHAYVIMLIFFVQAQVFRELSNLFESGSRPAITSDEKTHSTAYIIAKEKKRAERARYSKTVTWYFFAVTNYFLYGETIIHYFKHIVMMDAYFLTFTKHHRFISFSLWTLGFVGFVTTLNKANLRRQFGLFCWIHISLFLIVVSSHFIVNSILEGLIWFWVPASLVICNDIWAYICGMSFGKTPLIQLSPKKTVEGFVGALFCTIVFAYFWATIFMRIPYFICPCRDLGMTALSNIQCDPNPVFLWRELPLYAPISSVLSQIFRREITSIPWTPFQLHAVVLAVFASLVAPFGGFFASGFKRAFNVKDFGDSIPGHGGMTDRMDCQFLMGMFSYVYYASLIRVNTVTVISLYESAVTSLSSEEIQSLVKQLTLYLSKAT